MSQTAVNSSARVVVDPATPVPDVRHIWLPSQRSLCELAVRAVATSAEAANELNIAARALPGCSACVMVTEMLSKSAALLSQETTAPSRAEARALLSSTTWPWVASFLVADPIKKETHS